MSAFRSLFAHHEARAALAVWVLLPTLFLFFMITLAVDPATQLSKVHLGVAVLDAGVDTPQGHIVLGARLAEGMHDQVPVQVVPFQSEGALRDAVLAHDVAGGIVLPQNISQNVLAHKPVQLSIVRSDANDPFTNAFMTNISTQIATNLNSALPQLTAAPGAQQAASQPLVTVAPDVVAAAHDFRFPTIPALLILPVWIATLAFSVLISRAGDKARQAGAGAIETGIAELAAGVAGAAIAAAVITLDIALFTWRWDLDFVGLFAVLWLGLAASAWLLQGTIRLMGFALGAALGVIALFIQQSVSGATMPSAFAPDIVGWATDISPLRYIVEAMRNLLIGGSTTGDVAIALAVMACAGLLIYLAGVARLSIVPGRQRPPQTVATA